MKEWLKKFIPKQIFNLYYWAWSLLGAIIYGFPGRKLKIIGITGTNGKTSVVHLLSEILTEAKLKTASISSLRFKIGSREWINDLKMTMPGRLKIQGFLSQAKKAGCSHVVLEVTSEGIKQNRHCFIPFTGAIFTNLSKEHLETHGSFENYKKAKLKLFRAVQEHRQPGNFLAVNLDDPAAQEFLNFKVEKKIGYTTKNPQFPIFNLPIVLSSSQFSILKAEKIKIRQDSASFIIDTEIFKTHLPGKFNIYNALAAISTAQSLGIDNIVIKDALAKFKGAAGRLETVIIKPFKAVVDYGHTPDALENVYSTLKNDGSKLICVLGATGGGRDKWKRPELGKLAAKFCQRIIITNEDPYDENPLKIMEAIEKGVMETGKKAEKILDRKEAIKKALSLAKKNNAVIITGKGAEPWMVVAKGKKIPWDDRLIVKQSLVKLKIIK